MAGETTWDGFSDKVFSGSVRLNVADGIADQAARHAADVLDAVQSVLAKRFVGRLSEGQTSSVAGFTLQDGFGYKGFGELRSGQDMTAMFTKLDSDLVDALKAQEKILSEMGNAFACAAKGYKSTEDESKSYFNSLKPGSNSGPYTGIDEAVQQYVGLDSSRNPKIDDWGSGKDSVLKNSFSGSHKDASLADPGYKARYNDSLEPAESIGSAEIDKLSNIGITNGGQLVQAGAVWKSWASFLQGKFAEYKTNIGAIQDTGQWTGPGIESINNALTSYMAQVHTLTESIGAVGDLLVYSGGWVSSTYEQAATAHANHKNDERKMVEEFRPVFKAVYQYGWNQTFNSLPGIPSPSAMVSPFTPGAPKGDGKQPGGYNPSGSGTPSSPSTPSLTDQPKVDTPNPNQTPKDNPTQETPKTTTTTDQTSQITSLISTLAQQGASLAENLASTGSSLIQALEKSTTTTDTTKTTDDLAKQIATLTNLPTVPTDTKTSGGSPGSPGGSPSAGIPKETVTQSKLFPRSTVSSTDKDETVSTTRAGLATGAATTTGAGTTGSSGMPMGSGAQAGSQGAGKEHKRPEFLRSGANLDEVFEDIPAAVRSVAEK
ncbi:hypothetical protein [Nocardia acidivorans]|uniref:hypothetical protein n=1 Tax=Nocardia acidivorans TaxID=404580 RepID=UPI000833D455|nr:hypothetical protein [Nocardia acidivorans]